MSVPSVLMSLSPCGIIPLGGCRTVLWFLPSGWQCSEHDLCITCALEHNPQPRCWLQLHAGAFRMLWGCCYSLCACRCVSLRVCCPLCSAHPCPAFLMPRWPGQLWPLRSSQGWAWPPSQSHQVSGQSVVHALEHKRKHLIQPLMGLSPSALAPSLDGKRHSCSEATSCLDG